MQSKPISALMVHVPRDWRLVKISNVNVTTKDTRDVQMVIAEEIAKLSDIPAALWMHHSYALMENVFSISTNAQEVTIVIFQLHSFALT